MGERTRSRTRARRASPGAAVLLAIITAGAGCSVGDPTGPTGAPDVPPTVPAVAASPGDIDPALLAPLTALGPCEVDVDGIDPTPLEGLVLPPDTVVTAQTTDGPLTTVRGYVPMTPVQIRVHYQRDPALEIVHVEDEIRESETLVDTGDHRLFVKAQAVCEQGSVLLAVVAPDAASAPVPVPTGAAP